MKNRDGKKPPTVPPTGGEPEDFAQLLEEHLQKHPPISKTEEPKLLRNSAHGAPKKNSASHQTLDLHGKSLVEAKDFLSGHWQQLKSSGTRRIQLRIITGKGIHSGESGPVLVEEIHSYVRRLYGSSIVRIDEDPSKVKLAGMPLRGHFDVELLIK